MTKAVLGLHSGGTALLASFQRTQFTVLLWKKPVGQLPSAGPS